MKDVNLLAIDIAKINFQLHGIDLTGNIVLRKKLTRNKLIEYVSNLPSCTIAMEACVGANFWARKFTQFRHTVKLISPQLVKPFEICCVFVYVLSLYIINQPFAYFLLQYNILLLHVFQNVYLLLEEAHLSLSL